MGYLVIRSDDVQRIYIDEIALLMLENPAVSLTGCLIEALTEKKIKVVFCDTKHNPVSELVPYHGSHDSSLRIRMQCAWKQTDKAAMWQRIIREKISKQADFLKEIGKNREFQLLHQYITDVQPHDSTNREGHAAKVYFNALFGMDFTRGADSPINAALDYGYSIILSAFNRAVASNGHITQIGIFHDNMYNHFNLSSDIMEPFRVLIDRVVYEMQPAQFEREQKHALWQVFGQTVYINGSKQLVSVAIRIYARSVLEYMNSSGSNPVHFYSIL